jgi:hypothetical protein
VPNFTIVQVSGGDCPNAVAYGKGEFLYVQPEFGLSGLLGRTVAMKALARENGTNVTVETYGLLFFCGKLQASGKQGDKGEDL